MAFEFNTALGQASPPNLLYVAESANVDSWALETVQMPKDGPLQMNRRRVIYLALRAINTPATAQFASADNIATFFFFSRAGKQVTPHLYTRLYQTGGTNGNANTLPAAWWQSPLIPPVHGDDILNIAVPGDSNATPVQDWQLSLLMGPELKR